MSSLNFIGGEKGGVGKSVVARLLAQYLIDKDLPFMGFDTDRSHTSFTRFYADYAAPVLVDSYEGLDRVVSVFENANESEAPRVIVDLAAQTAMPLSRWIKDSDLLPLLADMGVAVNFWHVADAGKDSVDLLDRLLDAYGEGPNYLIVKNMGRGTDFSQLEASPAMARALEMGAKIITLAQLHEGSMRKIDRQNASFWAALHNRSDADALGLLERQRVKNWLRKSYESFDSLPI
ncbi:mobilization protein [Rhodoferax sp.]|uniref:mobilization protein n=1 Tax=Rhodoferax sp. TaxID=50421 RepID=UPI0025D873C2|nr:mobilization protein [Rhodoferax sp.]